MCSRPLKQDTLQQTGADPLSSETRCRCKLTHTYATGARPHLLALRTLLRVATRSASRRWRCVACTYICQMPQQKTAEPGATGCRYCLSQRGSAGVCGTQATGCSGSACSRGRSFGLQGRRRAGTSGTCVGNTLQVTSRCSSACSCVAVDAALQQHRHGF